MNYNISFNGDTTQLVEISVKNGTLNSIKDVIRKSCSKALMLAIRHNKENIINYLSGIGVYLSMQQFTELISVDRIIYTKQPSHTLITNDPFYYALNQQSVCKLGPDQIYTDEQLDIFYKLFEMFPEDTVSLDYPIIKVVLRTYRKPEHLEKLIRINKKEKLLNCSITNKPNINTFRSMLLKSTNFTFDEINNALLIAIENKELSIFDELLIYLPQISYDKNNLVHYRHLAFACQYGYLDIVKMLIEERNTSINYNQNYLIRNACEKGQIEIVKYLVSKGADPTLYNNSCIKRAIINEHLELVEYLLSIGCDATKWITKAISTSNINIIRLLENYNYNIIQNELSLIHAIDTLNYPLIKYLVENGADVSIRSHYPLRYAAAHRVKKIVELLLSHGADISSALSCHNLGLIHMAKDYLDRYNHYGIFIGPLQKEETECGICYNALRHSEKNYQCEKCNNFVHYECQLQWFKGCIYCRSD